MKRASIILLLVCFGCSATPPSVNLMPSQAVQSFADSAVVPPDEEPPPWKESFIPIIYPQVNLSNFQWIVQRSTDLKTWTDYPYVIAGGAFHVTNSGPIGFYRIKGAPFQ